MSVARFIADQRTNYAVPVALTCALLGISISWFYKWWQRALSPSHLYTTRDLRRDTIDRAVKVMFVKQRGLHGSPRLVEDLREDGWVVSEKTVAKSMRRQGLIARKIKRRNGLTKQDKTKAPFPDLINRDFTAAEPNQRWVGDITEIPTAGGKLYLATVIDLFSRRLIGAATSRHPNAELAKAAITMAVTVRGGKAAIWREEESERVIFHTDRGSTYTADLFTKTCKNLGIRQSLGTVGSCFDNSAAEAFFSTLEWEVLSRNEFETTTEAATAVMDWCWNFYNTTRRHSSAAMMSPIAYETAALTPRAA